jgi:predicted ferric reductase
MNIAVKKTLIYVFFVANLAVTLSFWWTKSGSLLTSGDASSVLIALGRLFGLIGALLVLTQLVLIGRIKIVEQQFGFDKLNNVHRWIGYCWLFFIPLHPIFLILGYAKASDISLWAQFLDFITHWQYVMWAFLGLCLLIGIITISYAIIRRRLKYETWYFIHLFVYVAIGLMFPHQTRTADISNGAAFYYWYVLNFTIFGLVLLYRFIRPLYNAWKYQFRVDRVVRENPYITSVYIAGRNLEKFNVKPGQYAHNTFLAKKFWFTHPFSFSASPNGKYLRLSIKAVGDFTATIPNLPTGTRVIIDGPFGVFTEERAKRDKFLFIAGGIGITPIYSLIESMSQKNKDMVLIYGNKTPEEAAFLDDLAKLTAKVIPVYSHTKVEGFESGYVDVEKVQRLCPDFLEREIYVCGPPPMTKGVIKFLRAMGVQSNQLHYERFGY